MKERRGDRETRGRVDVTVSPRPHLPVFPASLTLDHPRFQVRHAESLALVSQSCALRPVS